MVVMDGCKEKQTGTENIMHPSATLAWQRHTSNYYESNEYSRRRRPFWHATQDCVAPYVDIILHRGLFWAKSAALGERKVVLFQILLDGAEPRDAGTT